MKKISFFIVVVLLLFLVISLPQKLIKVNDIICESQYGQCPQEIESRLQSYERNNMKLVKKNIANELKNNFLVSDYSVQYRIPDKLKVNLVVKKAIFSINQRDTKNYVLVDKDGFIVGISSESNLPTVIKNEKLKNVGEKVEDRDVIALKIIEGVYTMYQVNVGEMEDNTLVVEMPNQLNVIFPLELNKEFDANYYLGALRLIISKIESGESGNFRELDLRFRNPVLR